MLHIWLVPERRQRHATRNRTMGSRYPKAFVKAQGFDDNRVRLETETFPSLLIRSSFQLERVSMSGTIKIITLHKILHYLGKLHCAIGAYFQQSMSPRRSKNKESLGEKLYLWSKSENQKNRLYEVVSYAGEEAWRVATRPEFWMSPIGFTANKQVISFHRMVPESKLQMSLFRGLCRKLSHTIAFGCPGIGFIVQGNWIIVRRATRPWK